MTQFEVAAQPAQALAKFVEGTAIAAAAFLLRQQVVAIPFKLLFRPAFHFQHAKHNKTFSKEVTHLTRSGCTNFNSLLQTCKNS